MGAWELEDFGVPEIEGGLLHKRISNARLHSIQSSWVWTYWIRD